MTAIRKDYLRVAAEIIGGLLVVLSCFAAFGQSPLVALTPYTNNVGVVTQITAKVVGGLPDAQYWIKEGNPSGFSDWRRFYSSTYHENTEVPVFSITAPSGTAASKPFRWFKIGDKLPD